MNEDLPEEYLKARRILVPVMKAAIAAGYKSTLKLDKVMIDSRLYGTNQLTQLPSKCDPALQCTKQTGDVHCFFGMHTPLSNFYPCSFTVNQIQYSCTEQFIQSRKSECLGNESVAQKIMLTTDPTQMKKLGGSVKGNIQKWYAEARDTVLPAIRAKFSQNPKLKEYLLKTDNKIIGEASLDSFWGISLKLSNPNIKDINLWSGKNEMGKILMTVRAEP